MAPLSSKPPEKSCIVPAHLQLPFSKVLLLVYVRHTYPSRSGRVREWWVKVVPEHIVKQEDFFCGLQHAPITYLGQVVSRDQVLHYYNADSVYRDLLEATNCRLLYSAILKK